MATGAESGKIDPMHQFTIEPLARFEVGGFDLSFTNSALWMVVTLGAILPLSAPVATLP